MPTHTTRQPQNIAQGVGVVYRTAHVSASRFALQELGKPQYSDFPVHCQNISRMLSAVWLFKLPVYLKALIASQMIHH